MSLASSCSAGRPNLKRTWTLTLLGCSCLLGITAAWVDWDFERIIRNAEHRYGALGGNPGTGRRCWPAAEI